MDITQILGIFSNPETISTLGNGGLLKAIIFTIIMGMGTTTIVLIILMFCTSAMYKILGQEKVTKPETNPSIITETSSHEDEELAVVITTAVAAILGTSSDNISIRSIKEL